MIIKEADGASVTGVPCRAHLCGTPQTARTGDVYSHNLPARSKTDGDILSGYEPIRLNRPDSRAPYESHHRAPITLLIILRSRSSNARPK